MYGFGDQKDECEIIKRVIGGDIASFEKLLKKNQAYVFRIVSKHVPAESVEDVAQEVFVSVFTSIGKLKKVDRFRVWLARITHRACYDFWRRRYRYKETALSNLSKEQKNRITKAMLENSIRKDDLDSFLKEGRRFLRWALEKLTPEDRMVVELQYLEGRSGREVADLMGWSLANVKIRAFRARKKLERLFQEVIMEERENQVTDAKL